MKVILQQDVKKVGNKGDIVEVSEGYGRNFLLPKKLVEATAANLETAKQKANSAARKKQQATDEARLLAAQLEKVSVKVAVRIGEGGKLFGSVTGKDVADALAKAKEHGIDVDPPQDFAEERGHGRGRVRGSDQGASRDPEHDPRSRRRRMKRKEVSC